MTVLWFVIIYLFAKIILDSVKPVTMIMPPATMFRRGNSWTLTYELNGNGGNYVLVTNSKPDGPAKVIIKEDGPAKSHWLIYAAKDQKSEEEGDDDDKDDGMDFTDCRDEIKDISPDGFYYGSIWIGFSSPDISVVAISKRLMYKIENGKMTFHGVNNLWLRKQTQLFDSLEALANEKCVNQFLISGLQFDKKDASVLWGHIPYNITPVAVSAIYSTETSHPANLRVYGAPNGFIYTCLWTGAHGTFWGVNGHWIEANGGKNLFNNLENLYNAQHPFEEDRKKTSIVHLQNFELPEIGNKNLSGAYSIVDDTILAFSDVGIAYRISRDLQVQVVALTVDITKPLSQNVSSMKDIILHSLDGADGVLAPLITIFGLPEPHWYKSTEKVIIRGHADFKYGGEIDGLHILESGGL